MLLGCVAYPLSKKKPENKNMSKRVTRIVSNTFFLKNELAVYSIINNMPDAANYFYIFFEKEKLEYHELNNDESNNESNNEFVWLQSSDRFVLHYEPRYFYSLDETFLFFEAVSPVEYLHFMMNVYSHLLDSINLLNQHDIIHFVSEEVIGINESREPIFINFAKSLYIISSNVRWEYIQGFLPYADESWPSELRLLSHLQNRQHSLSKMDLETIVEALLLSEEDEKKAFVFFNQYINLPIQKVFQQIFQYSDSWGQYSLDKLILKRLLKMDPNNVFVKGFKELLLEGIHIHPKLRPTIQESKYKFEKLCYETNRSVFREIAFVI